jgi:hypothetical protein
MKIHRKIFEKDTTNVINGEQHCGISQLDFMLMYNDNVHLFTAVSHIPQLGDATTSPAGDALSQTSFFIYIFPNFQ